MTQAKKADDDYDYPEDLPQVMLNRPKAMSSRAHPHPETRLSMSLFGQLFDELHFLEPALLRMGYTHPMDDGQQRTFKVKFEGEGVDDYGGPYREIFGQVAEELQITRKIINEENLLETGDNNQGEKVVDPIECILPLLNPSPNWLNEMGEEREKFLPQPHLNRHLYLEMYNFLGQMLGIA